MKPLILSAPIRVTRKALLNSIGSPLRDVAGNKVTDKVLSIDFEGAMKDETWSFSVGIVKNGENRLVYVRTLN